MGWTIPSTTMVAGVVMLWAACDPAAEVDEAATWRGGAGDVVMQRCATCHRDGDIAPFPLTTYDDVVRFATPVRAAIETGTMPPWQPSDDCGTYREDIDLTDDERALLLDFLDAGTPEGSLDLPEPELVASASFATDLQLKLPEPYTPTTEPDDYRCQIVDWPEDDTAYITGMRITPEVREIVHHVIVFAIGPESAETFRAYDEADAGPGYACFGGPTGGGGGAGLLDDLDQSALLAALAKVGVGLQDALSGNLDADQIAAVMEELGLEGGMQTMGLGGTGWVGSWVPGTPERPFPEGTGIRIEPGSLLIVQMHYNTLSADPVADQSTVEIAVADSVEREAMVVPFTDLGWVSRGIIGAPMEIPAGEPSVSHDTVATASSPFFGRARDTLGLADDAPLVVHNAGHHMHTLGTSQRTEVRHADGSSTCVLDIPKWDFAWQGGYTLETPITLAADDEVWMGCTWDNSAENQQQVDGEALTPIDVEWGEGTTDEMCLGVFYVTGE